jgi:hypothetical protein
LKKPFVLLGVLNRPPPIVQLSPALLLVRCPLLGSVYLINGHTEQYQLSVTIYSTE